MLERLRISRYLHWIKGDQELGSLIPRSEDRRQDRERSHTKLFLEFSRDCRLDRFARHLLAAWELPQASVSLVEWALADEEEVTPLHDGCNDGDEELYVFGRW